MKLDAKPMREVVYTNPLSGLVTIHHIIIDDRGFENYAREHAARKNWSAAVSQLKDEGYVQSFSNESLFVKGMLRASIHWMRDSRERDAKAKKDADGNVIKKINRVIFYTGEVTITRWSEPDKKAWMRRR